MNSLRYREITLKIDMEPTIIASRNRKAENCKAEVTLEDAVKETSLQMDWWRTQ